MASRKKLQHKVRAAYQKLADTPYFLKPGGVYQIPGTRYGVKRLKLDGATAIVPIRFDKLGEDSNTANTT
ncbi:MAG: hypothetical protein AAGJ46_12065 [Planctomycetota bacterium]